uniref:sulfatase n=1 Tax=Pararhizobium sp. IMCC3301 TaxID=3067904 RepID=UPI0027423732|nr:sulfatase [Pararhizobium sp. IMCC3301]
MRTVFVLFDSLNRAALGAYGGSAIATPNFDRFAKRSMTFDRHYTGSLPCMPARRDMHTGRLNFMHRPWGPLEPFDNSFAQLLSQNGVYSHIVSDHLHYFENGGTGYVNAFDSWDFIRGQEYDPIKVMTQPPVERLREKFDQRHYPMGDLPSEGNVTRGNSDAQAWRRSRHAINTLFMEDEQDYPTAKCFKKAFEFLDINNNSDDWFLQLECFDPHEPFTAPARFRAAYDSGYNGKILDWPIYEKVTNSAEEVAEIRANYAALVAMCDEYFGQLLDWFDREDAWADTALILTTDHGYLLGEHEWWAKNKMPYYEEISHIPMMIWHPGMDDKAGTHCQSLTQTPDLMPTILDFYNVEIPKEVTAHSLKPLLNGDKNGRESAILGMFAGPICATDGRYTYYRFPDELNGAPLPAYTVMPSHLASAFSIEELKSAELVAPFDFTKGAPVMRYTLNPDIGETGVACVANWGEGSCLFDLESDPKQETPIDDPAIIDRLNQCIIDHLTQHNAPEEVFAHYGLEKLRLAASA